jgi:hypothetical protein
LSLYQFNASALLLSDGQTGSKIERLSRASCPKIRIK